MKVEGEHTFAAARELVWEALLDPEVLSRTLPGMTRLERVSDDRFEATMNIKVGPVQGKFDGDVRLDELDPPAGYRMRIRGKGAPGFVDGTGTIRLEVAGERQTRLLYDVDVQVGGRIAGVGQRLLESTSKVLTRQALESLDKQVAARQAAADGGGRAVEVAAPTQAEFAAGVTRKMAAELVPRWARLALLVVALAAAVVLILAGRACG